jgi:hypothetical protein
MPCGGNRLIDLLYSGEFSNTRDAANPRPEHTAKISLIVQGSRLIAA